MAARRVVNADRAGRPRRNQQRDAGSGRSLFRSPAGQRVGWRSPARPSPTPRTFRISPAPTPDRAGSRGRPSPGAHRAQASAQGHAVGHSGQLLVASANLVRLLVLDPNIGDRADRAGRDNHPTDSRTTSHSMTWLSRACGNRPELAGAQELVEAPVLRFKQAKLRPFVPSLAVSYAGGGFGGGAGLVLRQLRLAATLRPACSGSCKTSASATCAIMHRRSAENRDGEPPEDQGRSPGRRRRGCGL